MSTAVIVVLVVAASIVCIALVLQVDWFFRGRTIISARQFGLRIACGFLLLITLALIYFGLAHEWDNTRMELLFWSALLFLPLMLFVLAFMDFKEAQAIGELRRVKLYTDVLKDTADKFRNSKRGDSPPPKRDD